MVEQKAADLVDFFDGDVANEEENDEDIEGLMTNSRQTDQERRQIRKSQRLLQKTIEEGGDDLELEEIRTKNNEIFRNVLHTREAVLDGENMNAIATRATQQVDRLIQVPRYDADKLVSKLVQKCKARGGYFDWALLGSQAGVCFNALPSNISFLYGPLTDGKTLEVKQRAKRVVVQEDSDAEEENPEDVKGHTDRNADQLSAIEKSMKDLQKTLRKRVNETYQENKRKLEDIHGAEVPNKLKKKLKKHGVEIDAIQFLFNPKSFTQTVENIFHYSFLVKKGSASLKVQEKGFGQFLDQEAPGGIVAKYVQEKGSHPPPRQSIVSLTMQDWRDLCKAYNVEKGDLPHRTGSKQTKRVALSQLSQSSS